jgi:DNA replication protein DnaC
MHLEQTLTQLRSMRLTTMATALDNQLKNADRTSLSHEEFVALLVQEEYSARHNRRLSRMIINANFKPEQACLENIHHSPQRGFMKKDLQAFSSSTWILNAQNVIITGATGTGKTYIAEAIGLQACHLGFSVVKIRYKRLFEEIQAARATGMYLKYLETLAKIKILIIDDFVMETVTNSEQADLMEIIEDRNQKNPIIVTTQYPMNKWHTLLPDPTIADAICDRLIHTSIKLNLKGESMRMKSEKPC